MIASSDPAGDVVVIATSDTVDLVTPVRALRVAVAGNVQITTGAGNKVVLAFTAGETRAVRASRVWTTNTTATTIEGMI